jgi:hypothetical protein
MAWYVVKHPNNFAFTGSRGLVRISQSVKLMVKCDRDSIPDRGKTSSSPPRPDQLLI